jgi:hypothetical protein
MQASNSSTDHGGEERRSGMLGSGGPLDPHDAKSGVKVYMDV